MYRSLFASPQNRQSPVDISTDAAIYAPDKCKASSIKLKYNKGDCHEVVVLPTTWMLRTNDDCKTTFTASHLPAEFRLLQIHGHWGESADCGSEHSIDYRQFSGEIHFVFWNTNYELEDASNHPDGMAVLAVFLTEGKYNHDYAYISGVILEAVNNKAPVSVPRSFDLTKLLPEGSDYVFYEGSLTTPPYTECVLWTVMLEPVEVSVNQLRQFRRIGVTANCRNVQPICGREIYSSRNLSKM
ncbi:carbonate dehydratase, eukaryotic-type [Ancylostoma caninum]|uniref:Carbonic anhydrase n=1 Tax=Ancylostoma caninum TaxID=29170 RepID=A0A368FYR3_ANCCA|nr:carbonate dehydratase, eukaryotic-type [Ancylostoma caninum]